MEAKIYIFRNLNFTLLLMLSVVTANSQGTIQTPMGQTVSVVNNWDTPQYIAAWESEAAQWIINNNSDAQRIGAATSNYNCHSYAWNVIEGGSSTNKWINQFDGGNSNYRLESWDIYCSGKIQRRIFARQTSCELELILKDSLK